VTRVHLLEMWFYGFCYIFTNPDRNVRLFLANVVGVDCIII